MALDRGNERRTTRADRRPGRILPIKPARATSSVKRMFWILVPPAIVLALLAIYVTQPVFVEKHAPSGTRVDPDRLRAHVRVLSETFAPRDAAHPENLDRIAEYIEDRFRAAGAAATSFQPVDTEKASYRNVIASFGPDARERIVVGAHYDAEGEGIGADDNASGVAVLLELGFLL